VRVAIHQPEFAPWLGYFHKMHSADVYVFLDNVQFKKRYFENRNYLRDSTKDEKVWLTIPVETKGKYNQAIKDVVIKNNSDWITKTKNKVTHLYGDNEVTKGFNSCLDNNNSLMELNLRLINFFRKSFGIKSKVTFQSSLNINSKGSDLIFDICETLNADTYVCGKSGEEYLDLDKFKNAEISIEWQNFTEPNYFSLVHGSDTELTNLSSLDFVQLYGLDCEEKFKDIICHQ